MARRLSKVTRAKLPTIFAYPEDLLETNAWGSWLSHLACCELTETRLHVFGQDQSTALILHAEGAHVLRTLHADRHCSLLGGVPQNEHEYRLTATKDISTLGRLRVGTIPGRFRAKHAHDNIS